MNAAYIFLAAWLVTTLGLAIALGAYSDLAKENRRLRARDARKTRVIANLGKRVARAEATSSTALHIASEHVQSQRGLRVVEGGAS